MKLKGQSSIEYLSTYGWMLIVVAIAAGVFYNSYVPEQQCQTQVTQEMANQLQIADMATDPQGDLAILIRNMGSHQATVKQITATHNGNTTTLDTNVSLGPVEEEAFRLNGTTTSENCNQVEIRFNFNSSNIGEVVDEGEIEGEFTVE